MLESNSPESFTAENDNNLRLLKWFNIVKAEKIEGKPDILLLELKYNGKQPAIQSIKRESKPGHRVYCKAEDMPRILNDYGMAIVSTSQGLMTNKDARKNSIGGEIICSIY